MADTQPLEDALGSQEATTVVTDNWGWLVTLHRYRLCVHTRTLAHWYTGTPLPRHQAPTLTALQGPTVSVGREGNIVIDERLFEGAGDKQHLKTSRVHFEVFVRNGLVGLVDKSLHGTFVKGLKVGKDKEYRLNHGDVISVVEAQFEVYCLLLEEQVKLLFPEELGRKYLVGRVARRGASATIREGFSKKDHNRRAVKLIEKESSSDYSNIKDIMREVKVLKGVHHP